MLLTNIVLAALLLLSGTESCAAKAILHRANTLGNRRHGWDDLVRRTTIEVEDNLYPREALPQPSNGPSNSVTTPVTPNTSNLNTTAACIKSLSALQNASNPSGIVACYDIPYLNTTDGEFTAELRLYQISPPSGSFVGVQVKNILTSLKYPAANIAAMTKRVKRGDVAARQNSGMQVLDELSFAGQIDQSLDLSKLNNTELMSLLIPNIALEAVSPSTNQPVMTNLTSSDIAFFPTGAFSGQLSNSATVASNPSVASEAVTKAAGFTLPGVTFGIFPTGLIVTGAWTVMFLAAFGFGTLGRIWHRKQYRNRISNPRMRRR